VDFLFAYTGRERDEETGLYYYRARYYDPAVGRFVSEDPLGFAAGDTNLVRYVGNKTLIARDPMGRQETIPPFNAPTPPRVKIGVIDFYDPFHPDTWRNFGPVFGDNFREHWKDKYPEYPLYDEPFTIPGLPPLFPPPPQPPPYFIIGVGRDTIIDLLDPQLTLGDEFAKGIIDKIQPIEGGWIVPIIIGVAPIHDRLEEEIARLKEIVGKIPIVGDDIVDYKIPFPVKPITIDPGITIDLNPRYDPWNNKLIGNGELQIDLRPGGQMHIRGHIGAEMNIELGKHSEVILGNFYFNLNIEWK
jgi:RHS repeat-associated protein